MTLSGLNEINVIDILENHAVRERMRQYNISKDIKNAFTMYIDKKEKGVLKYLVGEKEFSEALAEVLHADRSIEILNKILNHIMIKRPEQQIFTLEQLCFASPGELCDYFSGDTAYYLTNRFLAKIIGKRPDREEGTIPLIIAHGYINIEQKKLYSKVSRCNAKSSGKEGEAQIISTPQHIIDLLRDSQSALLFEVNRIFGDKSMYEIFEVDPIDVLNTKL